MKKLIAAGAMTAVSIGGFSSSAEDNAAIFDGAPNGITTTCASHLIQLYEIDFLSAQTAVDIRRAEKEDPPTAADARERAEKYDGDDYPDLRNYIENRTRIIQNFRLPRSLITVEVLSDVNGWRFDPEAFDSIIEQSLLALNDDESLQAMSYQCIWDEVYDRRGLAGHTAQIAVLGDGDRCILGGNRLVIRGEGPCTNNGWFFGRDGLMVLAPPDDIEGSRSAVHEMKHWIDKTLRIRSEDSGRFEFSGYEFEEIAYTIMQKQNLYPLVQETICERLVQPIGLC